MIPVSLAVQHTPVLLATVAGLARGRKRIVDGTAGGGGHIQAFLEAGATVIALDRDPNAIRHLRERFPQRLTLHVLPFADIRALELIDEFAPDFIFLDLGVSSDQIESIERGFTFRPGAPLDMRMEARGHTARELIAEAPEPEIARILREYGDEKRANRLARELVRRRENAPIAESDDLVNAIRAVLGPRSGPSDFARIFQAFRIAVNDELGQLEAALPRMRNALLPGGLLAVIAYHSGEDRVVKHSFREWGRTCICPPALPVCTCRGEPLGTVETRSPVTPDVEEIEGNPRSRSARLRVFRKGL